MLLLVSLGYSFNYSHCSWPLDYHLFLLQSSSNFSDTLSTTLYLLIALLKPSLGNISICNGFPGSDLDVFYSLNTLIHACIPTLLLLSYSPISHICCPWSSSAFIQRTIPSLLTLSHTYICLYCPLGWWDWTRKDQGICGS
jgi:hypothetical protein